MFEYVVLHVHVDGGWNPRNTTDLPHPTDSKPDRRVDKRVVCHCAVQTPKCYVTCRATCGRIIIYDTTSPDWHGTENIL